LVSASDEALLESVPLRGGERREVDASAVHVFNLTHVRLHRCALSE
jgi:hypothetical protein